MKKLTLVLFICFALLLMSSCSGDTLQDGTYSAQTTQDEHGWSDTLSVTYSGGVLTDAMFESVNEEGTQKSTLTAEQYPMDPLPSEWIPQLTQNVKNSEGNPDNVDAIAGASLGTQNAKDMLSAINENAKDGNTDTIIIEGAQ